jgi:hypothetical protein|tara:strand:- start:511 stop:726 length:216 start_codon:yes stop_codon:yes gene_type:complete
MKPGDLVKVMWRSRRWGGTPINPAVREFIGIVDSPIEWQSGEWKVIITELGVTHQFSEQDLEVIDESRSDL